MTLSKDDWFDCKRLTDEWKELQSMSPAEIARYTGKRRP